MVLNNGKDCCGCEACAQACPKNCIVMTTDEEGFVYPSIDRKSCVSCGICQSVCPVLIPKKKTCPIHIYAAYANDNQLRSGSSSGGVFSLLANYVLEQNGMVFGAAFDKDFFVHHISIRSKEELTLLRGSKYVQSRINNAYQDVKAALGKGVPILFSGVGCQIAGLKAYLGKEYEQLYTVDVLCHGVPSPRVWEKYIREQETQFASEVTNVSFRCKDSGWKQYSVKLSFSNGTEYRTPFEKDLFMNCFLSDICLRPSCYACKFRESRSGADLTLGDAWGIQRYMPEMDDDLGTSVVVVNTEKGRKLLDAISAGAEIRPVDAQKALEGNPVYYQSVKCHPKRAKFFASLDAPMEKLVALTRPSFFHRSMSFGKRGVKKVLRILGLKKILETVRR